jgi:hypothetical protein
MTWLKNSNTRLNVDPEARSLRMTPGAVGHAQLAEDAREPVAHGFSLMNSAADFGWKPADPVAARATCRTPVPGA